MLTEHSARNETRKEQIFIDAQMWEEKNCQGRGALLKNYIIHLFWILSLSYFTFLLSNIGSLFPDSSLKFSSCA